MSTAVEHHTNETCGTRAFDGFDCDQHSNLATRETGFVRFVRWVKLYKGEEGRTKGWKGGTTASARVRPDSTARARGCPASPLRPRQMDLASSDESEDNGNRTPPYGRQPQEDEDDEEEVVVVEEDDDATEEEQGADDDDDHLPPAALPVTDDLNALLCNIAAQLTVEFEETVNSWLPEVCSCRSPRSQTLALALFTTLGLTLT